MPSTTRPATRYRVPPNVPVMPSCEWGGIGEAHDRRVLGSAEKMRHEPAQVAGDAAGVLADAQPGRFVVDHPDAEDRPMPVELGQRRERLIDVAFLAVVAAGFLDAPRRLRPRSRCCLRG